MLKLKTREDYSSLPEPVALTPEQLKEMATLTAGGLALTSASLITRAGPYPPMPFVALGAVSTVSPSTVNAAALGGATFGV